MRRNHAEGKMKPTDEMNKANSERMKKWIKDNGHVRGMAGKFHTDETKRIISEKGKGRIPSREQVVRMMKTRYANGWSPPSVNKSWKAGKAEDLGDIHFRSAWERNYARHLNWLIERGEILGWEFEKDTFYFEGIKRGTVCYRPDFKVFLPSGEIEYHEVKGWMDPASITKIKRMAKYHPTVKLVVIDKKAYKALEKYAALFSPHWEHPPKSKPRKKAA